MCEKGLSSSEGFQVEIEWHMSACLLLHHHPTNSHPHSTLPLHPLNPPAEPPDTKQNKNRHSLHAIASQLSPAPGCGGIELLQAETFDLHCLQVGVLFVICRVQVCGIRGQGLNRACNVNGQDARSQFFGVKTHVCLCRVEL